jgi:hypothetical protein
MSLMEPAGPPVWPVDPATWAQADGVWVAEIQVTSSQEPARVDAVTVKLPDGRLVRYEGAAFRRFLDEWQFLPPESRHV